MILWKPGSASPRRASFRYRVALPALYLERVGVRSKIRWHRYFISLRGVEVLVFSKTFQPSDIALARRARAKGIAVIYDLCDNIFVEAYPIAARLVFEQIADMADAIVTPTQALADVIAAHIDEPEKIVVIPDCAEGLKDVLAVIERFKTTEWLEESLYRLRKNANGKTIRVARRAAQICQLIKDKPYRLLALSRYPTWVKWLLGKVESKSSPAIAGDDPFALPLKNDGRSSRRNERVVTWFGNHGGEYADFGILDVLIAVPALERVSREMPIRLRIISNHYKKYCEHIAPLPLSTEYFEWDPIGAHKLLQESDVVLLPSKPNAFTRCKSSNRTLLSLWSGVPVVVTRTPATADFEDCVIFDDWERGLRSYLTDDVLRRRHLARAEEVISSTYAPEVISRRWKEALGFAKQLARAKAADAAPTLPVLVFLINLVQDLDLILPLYGKARDRKAWKTELWVTTYDLFNRPEMGRRLIATGLAFKVVHPRLAGGIPDCSNVAALISASESSAAPHVQAHQTVRWVARHGARTYTLQHGFQNVGLTYGDKAFPIEAVHFASDVIFLWGTAESLHPRVSAQTRKKCVSVGCPKPLEVSTHTLPTSYAEPVVGVFENLHSPRYTDEYRDRFVDALVVVAKARSDLRFLLKPHPAGQWFMTAKSRLKEPLPFNVSLVDLRSPEWFDISAADILPACSAVITTVTTVALDAARFDKPVAIVGADYGGDLSPFRPLEVLKSKDDWEKFLRSAVDLRDKAVLHAPRAFVQRVLVEGDATPRILDRVESELLRPRAPSEESSASVSQRFFRP